MNEGRCRLCGKIGPLTKEHVPPHAAFNDHPILFYRFAQTNRGLVQAAIPHRDGFSLPVLCDRCNGRTGTKYGTEYVRFVKNLAEIADRAEPGDTVPVSMLTYPLRISKQALTIVAATCEPEVVEENPRLRSLILNRDETGMPDGLRLFAFIPAIRGFSKSTGRGAFISKERPTLTRLAENSWWPIGWVLTFDGAPLDDAFEITNWTRRPFKARDYVSMHLPVHWNVAMGPADFRSPERLAKEPTQVFLY